MSKKSTQNFKYIPVQILRPLKKFKVTWDLKKHYYTSENDPRIESDVRASERSHANFARKYSNLFFLKSTKTLEKALTDYEILLSLPNGKRASRYFSFRFVLNAQDSIAEKRSNLIDERLTKAANDILFFELALGKIPKAQQIKFLKDKVLVHFRYFLLQVFIEAEHTLSEKEERIISLKSGPSVGMWVQGTEKILSNRQITYKGVKISLPEATERINSVKPHEKGKLWNLVLTELEQISEVAENEFNAIVTNKKISDELRNFKKPYSQTVLSYENNESSIETLVQTISTKGFDLSKRFYKLKAQFHNVKQIPYARRYDPIGESLSIPFSQAVEICRDVFYSTHKEYGEFFDSMLTGGNIDVFPRKGKRGGAFMSSDVNIPTFVFLNHTNDLSSLSTLAHEMGHAIHSMRSKRQDPLYEGYSTTTAETASTLFENILFNALLKSATEKQKVMLLHEKIMRSISTIQRQIAFFNFEFELHTRIRKEGALTREELRKMMEKHLISYLGNGVHIVPKDGYSYVYISHFRYGFYVYTYTYGHLMSGLMADQLNDEPSYIAKIDEFLSSGGSDTVEHIFKKIGIDPLKKETFERSLGSLKRDIDTFERLI
jgi:oligoendopeptidase F